MDEVVLVAVAHAFDDLFKKYLSGFFIEFALFLHIFQQFSALQKLHDDCYLHILQCEAVVYFNDVFVVK
jgi:hypothetical protein